MVIFILNFLIHFSVRGLLMVDIECVTRVTSSGPTNLTLYEMGEGGGGGEEGDSLEPLPLQILILKIQDLVVTDQKHLVQNIPDVVIIETGDGNIMISDCSTGQTVGQLKGHSGHIMAVYADSDDIIASGSADNTVRLWDLRSQRCIDAIATGDSCVASVCVNTSGNMLASGK